MKFLVGLLYALGFVYGTSAAVYQGDPTKGGKLRGKRSSHQISERMLVTKSNDDYQSEVFDGTVINLNELNNEYEDVYWIGSNNLSTKLTCENQQAGEIMTGICGPGYKLSAAGPTKFRVKEVAKCQIGGNRYMRAIRCAKRPKQDFAWHDPNQPTWSGNNGNFNNGFHKCNDSSQFIAGFTFGDKSNDGIQSITCASGNTATTGYEVRLSQHEKKENICSAGRTAVCPIGYVVTSVCTNGNDGLSDLNNFLRSSRCGQGFCSNSEVPQQYVKSAVQCTKIAGYELKEESEDEQVGTIDEGAAQQFADRESCDARNVPGGSTFEVDESITLKSSHTREDRSSTVTGGSLKDSISTTATIGAEYGFAKSKVTGSVSNTNGSEVTSTFSNESTFVDQISNEKSTTTTLRTNIPLPQTVNDNHLVLRFSTVLEGAGEYTIKYNEYLPGNGNNANVVSDDVRIQTTSPENRNYIIVLSGGDVDTVRSRACKDIADDFLNKRGLFETTELEEDSGSSQEEMNLKVFMTKPESTNAPTEVPTKAPTVSPTLRPTTPAPTTTAPTASPTKASMPTTTQYTCVAVACSDGSDGSTCGSDGGCCPFVDTPSDGQCSCGTSWSDANMNKIPCKSTQQQPEPEPEETSSPTSNPTMLPIVSAGTCVGVTCSDGSDGSTCGSDGGCCPFADTPSDGQCSCGTSWSDAILNKIPCKSTQQQPEPETPSPTSNPTMLPTTAPVRTSCIGVMCSDGSDGSTCDGLNGCCPFLDTPSKNKCSCGTSWADANANKIECV
jgi:hypothetical protein